VPAGGFAQFRRRRNVLADAIRIGLVVAGVFQRQPLAILEVRRGQRERTLRERSMRTAQSSQRNSDGQNQTT
jgi:hypothetical protein